jgi:hypothetical protein
MNIGGFMAETVCSECGSEMPYDWAPCPHCGWEAPGAWEGDEEPDPDLKKSNAFLSKPQPWISVTAWILLGLLALGLAFAFWRRF